MQSAGVFETHTPWAWNLTQERLDGLIGAKVYLDVKGARSGVILPLSRWTRLRNNTQTNKRQLTPMIDALVRSMSSGRPRTLTARQRWEKRNRL